MLLKYPLQLTFAQARRSSGGRHARTSPQLVHGDWQPRVRNPPATESLKHGSNGGLERAAEERVGQRVGRSNADIRKFKDAVAQLAERQTEPCALAPSLSP